MHERHRSPYQSPSRSPWRPGKCPKEKRLRMAPRLIWPRAKHRVGLERPHFWTRFRGQSDPWGRSSPQRDSFRCFARVRRWIPEEIGEEGKICVLHSRNRQLLHPRLGPRNSLSKTCNHCPCQSHRAKKVKSGGRTPLFGSQSAQKFCPGRSRPLLLYGARVCFREARGYVTPGRQSLRLR